MRFSQRIGIRPVKEIIQKDKIDDDLRNSLWNAIYNYYLKDLPFYKNDLQGANSKYIFKLWINFYKLPMDDIPSECSDILRHIKSWFFDAIWWEVYDLIDFTAEFDNENGFSDFEDVVNSFLKQELSGYRLIDHKLRPITSDEEIREIQDVLDNTKSSLLSNIRLHFISSIDK
jgi:hypothetical protein